MICHCPNPNSGSRPAPESREFLDTGPREARLSDGLQFLRHQADRRHAYSPAVSGKHCRNGWSRLRRGASAISARWTTRSTFRPLMPRGLPRDHPAGPGCQPVVHRVSQVGGSRTGGVDGQEPAATRSASGFESGSDCVLTRFHKKFRAAEVRTIAAIFRDVGIRRTGFLMLGGPGETRATVEEGLAFVDSLDLDALKIAVGIRIYPETDLAATAVAEGMIASERRSVRPTFYLAPQSQGVAASANCRATKLPAPG